MAKQAGARASGKPDEISRIAAAILKAYQRLDGMLEPLVKKHPVQCKAGCYGCCYLLAMVAPSDGVLIAEHLLSGAMGPLDPWLDRLVKQAWSTMGLDMRGVTTLEYIRRRALCAFLDPETKLCTVYERRPVPCRTHFVISDPKLCDPDNETQKVSSLDTLAIDAQVQELFSMNRSRGIPLTAPIPIMVLFALQAITRTRGQLELFERIRAAAKGLPDPETYIRESHEMTDKTFAERCAAGGYSVEHAMKALGRTP